MPDYTMRDDWICFNYICNNGEKLYIETKLKTTVEEDMEAAIQLMEMTRNVS